MRVETAPKNLVWAPAGGKIIVIEEGDSVEDILLAVLKYAAIQVSNGQALVFVTLPDTHAPVVTTASAMTEAVKQHLELSALGIL